MTAIRRVEVGGRPVAFRESGEGEPIVLVHGWPLCSQTWRKVLPGLASDWRCIALDLLGAGDTPAPTGFPLDLAAQGEMIGGFLDALDLDRVVLIGHDSGGSVARACALANPERISRLVLADTEVPGHRPPLATAALRLASVPGSRALLGAVLRSRRLARGVFAPFFARPGSFEFTEFFDSVVAPNGRSAETADGSFRFLRDFDFRDVDEAQADYGRLTMPKLLIWGERDRAFPLAQGRRLAAQLPSPVRFEPVPGAGLFVHEEDPPAWVERVRSFLSTDG